ncbi:MAG: LysR family transcriptional regulator [Eubacterium sp.]|nr:LysR family transcriptional regulator [Eubacterium sp.]
MDTHQLEIFIASAQYLNFTKASKHLNMVPSNVSHSISMLEHELDMKLFNRNNNKLSLTADGQEFLKDAIRITTIAANAKNRTRNMNIVDKDVLALGVVYPEFIYKCIPTFRNFYKKYPMVNIQLMKYDSITVSRMLSDKQVDAAFGRLDMFTGDSNIRWKSLYKDPFMVVLHEDHPLAKEKEITIPMLRQELILLMNRKDNPGMFDMIQHLFLAHNMVPNTNDYSNHHLSTLILAAMNMGIVIIPYQNICYRQLPDGLVVKKLKDKNALHEIGIAWNNTYVSDTLSLFLKEFFIEN